MAEIWRGEGRGAERKAEMLFTVTGAQRDQDSLYNTVLGTLLFYFSPGNTSSSRQSLFQNVNNGLFMNIKI